MYPDPRRSLKPPPFGHELLRVHLHDRPSTRYVYCFFPHHEGWLPPSRAQSQMELAFLPVAQVRGFGFWTTVSSCSVPSPPPAIPQVISPGRPEKSHTVSKQLLIHILHPTTKIHPLYLYHVLPTITLTTTKPYLTLIHSTHDLPSNPPVPIWLCVYS